MWRWAPLAIVWSLAGTGITVELFTIRVPRWVTAGVYLVMGWLAIGAVQQILAAIPAGACLWLLAGGMFFTVGAVVYIIRSNVANAFTRGSGDGRSNDLQSA